MKNKKDCTVLYDLLLKQLKTKLKDPDCKDTTLKIALEFIKTYDLDEEAKGNVVAETIDDFISHLPYKGE
jgi:hypothetical protein|tara:strand:- start:11 stop:220 length:210 start_codon:yes stop_codon:yes gene_type:complete